MAPKKGRGVSRTTQQTAAAQRSRRGAANTNLEPINDNINAILSIRRGARAARGGRRERGGSNGGARQQRDASTSEGQQQQTRQSGEHPAQTSAQEQQQTGEADPGAVPSDSQHQDLTTSTEQSADLTSAAGKTANADQTQRSSSPQTTDDQTPKGDKDGRESKRRRSNDGQKPESPKKQKTDESSKVGETDGQQQQQQAQERGHCRHVREFIETHSTSLPAADIQGVYNNPVRLHRTMEDFDMYRALASVSEAVTERGTHRFSLMDSFTLQRAVAAIGSGELLTQVVARPGEEMFIPFTADYHNSLFILHREAPDRFQMLHYDSAASGHTGDQLAEHYAYVRRGLLAAEWNRLGPPTNENTISGLLEQVTARQQENWTCGLHVVFNAWAFALGLRLSGQVQRSDQFFIQGATLVRLAVRGGLDSTTIRDFLECHGFIEAGQEVSPARRFENTVAFPLADSLIQYAARVRIEERMPADWPPFATIHDLVRRDYEDDLADLSGMTADAYIALARDALARGGELPEGSRASTNPPQGGQSPDDTDQEFQRVLEASFDQSGTAPQPGETSGQAGQDSEPAGAATTTGQTAEDIRNDAAAAAELQDQLDRRLDPSMQSTGMSGATGTGPSGTYRTQGSTQSGGDSAGGFTSSSGAPQSEPDVTQQGPPAPDDEQQPIIPRTTALLNRIPPSMVPGTPEYDEAQRRRQAAREEARQRIEDAHAAAAAAGYTPAVPPAAGGSQGAAQDATSSNTEGAQAGEEDEETLQGDNPDDEDEQSEQNSPPEGETPPEGNAFDNDYDSLFDENVNLEDDEEDGNPDGSDDDDDSYGR